MRNLPAIQLIWGVMLLVLGACSSDQGGEQQVSTESQQIPAVDDTSNTMPAEMPMDNMQGMSGMSGMNHGETMPASDDLGQMHPTENNLFQVTIEAGVDPLPLNQIHGWILSLRDGTGAPVDNAEITVEGGMPAHNHGMPTAPQVTANLGGGRYQVDGVQFQMPGHWVVTFNITSGDQADSVTYKLMLQP